MLSTPTKTAADVTEASAENDLKSTAKSVGNKARAVYDDVSDEVGRYADDANNRIRNLTSRAKDSLNDAKGRINDAKNRLNDQINGQPVPSAAVALGLGLVLGLLLAAPRRRY
jgi:ElaB/YqjD/DUF883 family membrane-anchored ribosome-binding protein